MELFLDCFEVMGVDLLNVLEESRERGVIFGDINSTFVALIPKKYVTEDLEDFCPISLCNFIYKIISKIIANRLKPILSRGISAEQFGFLEKHRYWKPLGWLGTFFTVSSSEN